jgi:phosphoribosylformylglycinamidine synthase
MPPVIRPEVSTASAASRSACGMARTSKTLRDGDRVDRRGDPQRRRRRRRSRPHRDPRQFCWPSVDDEITMGTLVRAAEACRDAALAYGIPFISGKDSLHNQFTDSQTGNVIRIPNTLLISAIGVIEDVRKCVTMDLKNRTARVCLIKPVNEELADAGGDASRRWRSRSQPAGSPRATTVSDGGVAVAAAEMCIASGSG